MTSQPNNKSVKFQVKNPPEVGVLTTDSKVKIEVSPLQTMKAFGNVDARVHIYTAMAPGRFVVVGFYDTFLHIRSSVLLPT